MSKQLVIYICIFCLACIVGLEFLFIEYELFNYVPGIGIAFHLVGGFCISTVVYIIFYEEVRFFSLLNLLIYVSGVAALAAIGWEFFEWVLGWYTGNTYQGITIDNTMEDLLFSVLGGILSGMCLLIARKSR